MLVGQEQIVYVIASFIFILFFLSIKKNAKRNYKTEMVTLGILGTFIGTAIGLYHFNVDDIQGSLPQILSGFKTALITSVIGLTCSLITSLVTHAKAKIGTSLDDIHDNQLKMIYTLEKSLEQISKQANEEIVQALQNVVREFNTNLNEQFGSNFKELNNSVKHLVDWQENYKGQLAKYETGMNIAMTNMREMSEIKKKQEESIGNIIKNLETSSSKVTSSLRESTEIVRESMSLLLREANGAYNARK